MSDAKLYIVGTPIGNLGDFSPRAVETLKNVDFIAAEDTRVTLKLLNHFNIKKETLSYFEHNKKEKGELITERILSGESCAIVTDAGMPAISDPGEDLVRLCREKGIKVESVPSPTALTTALALSGMSTRRFVFEGFLPVDKKERKERLDELKSEKRTIVLYEAPHKLMRTLGDLYDYLGDREIALVREITKIHEETINTTLKKAIEKYESEAPKGEFVLVLEGNREKKAVPSLEETVKEARALIKDGMTKTAAAKEAAHGTPYKKNEIYKELIKDE